MNTKQIGCLVSSFFIAVFLLTFIVVNYNPTWAGDQNKGQNTTQSGTSKGKETKSTQKIEVKMPPIESKDHYQVKETGGTVKSDQLPKK